jgi:tripartite-type tricarboxylate transporter receptor subunit TctC
MVADHQGGGHQGPVTLAGVWLRIDGETNRKRTVKRLPGRNIMSRTFKLAVAALSAVVLQSAVAVAQDWPSKPVKILIGFGAGGGTDVATRIVAEGLSEMLGQQFTVENRPGAGGTIAGGMAARSPKDGYTAIALSMGHAVSAVMVKTVPYDPIADFAPIGIFTNSAIVVAVGKNSPATDLKGLVALVNKEPGKLNYSTVGLGSTQHLIAEDLVQRTGMKAQAIAYKTTGEVMTALIRGDSAFAVDLYHAIRGQVDAGELRVIATATPTRWGPIPNVPTVAESGLPGFGVLGWYGLAFPAGTPQPVIDKLRGALKEVLSRDSVKKKLEGVGAVANLSTAEEFRKTIESDIHGFKEVAGKAGLQAN